MREPVFGHSYIYIKKCFQVRNQLAITLANGRDVIIEICGVRLLKTTI